MNNLVISYKHLFYKLCEVRQEGQQYVELVSVTIPWKEALVDGE